MVNIPKARQLDWETHIAWGAFSSDAIDVIIEGATDKYENGHSQQEILDYIQEYIKEISLKMFDKGYYDKYIYDEQAYDEGDSDYSWTLNNVKWTNMAIIAYNYLVDSLNAPLDLPYIERLVS